MIAVALLFIALSVFVVSYEIRKGTKMASQALDTLLASVARIGEEVGETAEAIRNHVNSDSGISASVLLEAAGRLDAAAQQLDGLQAGLAGDSTGAAASSDVQSDDQSNADSNSSAGAQTVEPATGTVPATEGDLPASGNQNGIGSDFETGAGDQPGESGADAGPGQDDGNSDIGQPFGDEPPAI